MKTIRNILLAGALSLLVGCSDSALMKQVNRIFEKSEQIELTGTVISENYQKGEGFAKKNQYSFVINTEYGKKVIEIRDDSDDILTHQIYTKESADSLINIGDKVTINLYKQQLDPNSLNFKVDDFLKNVKIK